MKSLTPHNLSLVFAALAACFLMNGCVASRVVWSPDGAHAAVFAGDGLHLCGPDGALSKTILAGDGLGAWFPDSHRLAVVSELEKQSWKELQATISPEECERVIQGGKTVLEEFKAGHDVANAFGALTGLCDNEKNAVGVYLTEKAGTKEQAGTNWDALQKYEASVMQIRIGTLEGDALTMGPPLLTTLRKIGDVRVSPTGTAIAFTQESDKENVGRLLAVPVDGSAPPQLVASNTADSADWSADGHSLVYICASTEAGKYDETCLGSLSRRKVLDAGGKMEIQQKGDDLAVVLYAFYSRVRCLGDGRIIFTCQDIHLPCDDVPKQPKLFAVDPERQAAVIPLLRNGAQNAIPENPVTYETSPDGKRIVIGGSDGDVVVLTVATGELQTLQSAGQDAVSAPVWRSNDEVCYVSNAAGQSAQVVLWKIGNITNLLSANWPPEARKGFLEK